MAHAKLLNEAYVILSNKHLKQKYDKEQGYIEGEYRMKDPEFAMGDRQKLNDRQYKKAKVNAAQIIQDKAEKTQKKLLTIVAVGTFIGTLVLLFAKDPNKKQKPIVGKQ